MVGAINSELLCAMLEMIDPALEWASEDLTEWKSDTKTVQIQKVDFIKKL